MCSFWEKVSGMNQVGTTPMLETIRYMKHEKQLDKAVVKKHAK